MPTARGERDADRRAWGSLLGLLLVFPGCTPRVHTDDEPTTECAPSMRPLPVITTLVTREHEVTVHAGGDGLRFTVALADGALLGHQLSAREFERGFPTLHRRFDAAFAGDELWLDASLDGLRSTSHDGLRPGPGQP